MSRQEDSANKIDLAARADSYRVAVLLITALSTFHTPHLSTDE
jgi:hypothetical protein